MRVGEGVGTVEGVHVSEPTHVLLVVGTNVGVSVGVGLGSTVGECVGVGVGYTVGTGDGP